MRVNAGPIVADALFTLAGYGVLNASASCARRSGTFSPQSASPSSAD